MDDQPVTQPTDTPVVSAEPTTPVAPATQPDEPNQQPVETPVAPETQTAAPADTQTETVVDEEEELDYRPQQVPQYQPINFDNLPSDPNNPEMLDPNALANTINQSIAQAEARAVARAEQAFQEQRVEEKNWEKAYDKYPELRSNKELRDLVHRARLGEVTDLLSRNQDASNVKLPSPSQVAERFFKHIGSARAEGMKQANENTVIQNSAHVETAKTRSSDSDSRTKAFQNINNPNKEVAKQARQDLLKSMLFGDR